MQRHWRSLMVGFLGALQLILQCQAGSKTLHRTRASRHSLTPTDDSHQIHSHQRPRVMEQPHAVKRGLVDTQRLQFPSNKGNPTVALKRAMEGKLSSKLVSYYESFPFFWDSNRRRYAPRFTPHLTFYKDWSRKGVTKNNVPPRADSRKTPEQGLAPPRVALTSTNSATARNSVQNSVIGLKNNGGNNLVHPQGAHNKLLGTALPKRGPSQTGTLQVSVNHVANQGPVNSGPSQLSTHQAPIGTQRGEVQAKSEKSSSRVSPPALAFQNRNMSQENTKNAFDTATRSNAPSRAGVKYLPLPVNTVPQTVLPRVNTVDGVGISSQNTAPSRPQITGSAAMNGGIPRGYNTGNRQGYKTALPIRAPVNSGPPRAKIEPPPLPLLQSKPQLGENFKNAPDDVTKAKQIETAKPSGGMGPALAAASSAPTSGNPAMTNVVSDRGNARGIQRQVLNSPVYGQRKQTPAAPSVGVGRESASPPAYHAPSIVAAYQQPNGRFRGNQVVARGRFNTFPSSRVPPALNQQRADVYPGRVNRLNGHFPGNVHFLGKGSFQGNVARVSGNLNHLPNKGLLVNSGPAQTHSYGSSAQAKGPRARFPGNVATNNRISSGILGTGPPPSSTRQYSNGFRGSSLPVPTNPQQTVNKGNISNPPQTWRNSQKRTNGMEIERSLSQRTSVPYKSSYPIYLYKHSPGFHVKRNLKRTVETTGNSDAKARRRLLELRRK